MQLIRRGGAAVLALLVAGRRAVRYFTAAARLLAHNLRARLRLGWQRVQQTLEQLDLALDVVAAHAERVEERWLYVLNTAWRATLRRLEAIPSHRLIAYAIAIDIALAVGVMLAVLMVTRDTHASLFNASSAGEVMPPQLVRRLSPPAAYIPRRLAPTPTSTPPPTQAPTEPPTELPPVWTVTPLPIAYSTWRPYLPQDGGWNGPGQCDLGEAVFAPVGSGALTWPTDPHGLAGKNYNALWHPGLDLYANLGAPLYAADSGVVVYAGWNRWGYGNLVILDHGNGWHTLYAHLSQINVACGQALEQGQILGLAGSTGRSTGPHLHFEIRLGSNWVNPWNYLP